MSVLSAEQEAEFRAIADGSKAGGEGDAMKQLTDLLGLRAVGLSIVRARIVGRGSQASADLYLSDGTEITFERIRDMGNPSRLTLEVAACTGATPTLKARDAIRAVSLLRAAAERFETFTADQIAFDWGCDYLQKTNVVDIDMNDQGERWAAFSRLVSIDPTVDSRAEGGAIAAASLALRHVDGMRFVRCGWFKDAVRAHDPGVSPQELALRMERVGWSRRASSGRVKACQPGGEKRLSWTFYSVPVGWEERA